MQHIDNPPAPGMTDLLVGFLSLGLLGFGGIAPWARYIIVERKAWLSEKEYAEFIGIGQVLPGSNTVNAAILIGQKFHGLPGAVVAVTALMAMPLLVLVALAALYGRFAMHPEVGAALAGTTAAAAGLVIGTAIKMALRLRLTPMALLFGTVAFIAAGLLALPLLPTIGPAHSAQSVGTDGGAPMTKAALWPLLGAFAPLSLMMFGGANSIIPEIHRQAVEVHGWMNDPEFATLFAVAQAAPGPNILVVSLIGWQVAGLAGLLVATLAINVPHCALTYLVGSMIRRAKDAAWLRTLKEALVPITTGLILASGFVMGRAADHGPLSAIISAIAAGFVIFTDRNPLWMLAAASCAGLLGYHHEWLVQQN